MGVGLQEEIQGWRLFFKQRKQRKTRERRRQQDRQQGDIAGEKRKRYRKQGGTKEKRRLILVLDNFLWKKRYDHCWLYILILFYFSALFSVDCLDFNLLIGMDFNVQIVIFLSLILFSYLLCFGSFTLSLTFPEDNRCMGCF